MRYRAVVEFRYRGVIEFDENDIEEGDTPANAAMELISTEDMEYDYDVELEEIEEEEDSAWERPI